MQYLCDHCETIINEDELIQVNGDTTEFWGNISTEKICACPHCKCTDLYIVIETCEQCGAPILEGNEYYETNDGTIYCTDCITKKTAKRR